MTRKDQLQRPQCQGGKPSSKRPKGSAAPDKKSDAAPRQRRNVNRELM